MRTSRRRRAALAAVAIVVAGLATAGDGGGAAAGEGPPDQLRVELEDGVVQGDLVGGARQFLKIPYAAPPVGALRWEAPEPAEPWEGVRHETDFAEACPQNESVQGPASVNEDCLYANVWSPAPAPEGAPVMVWIHGGGNFAGSAGDFVPGTEQLWYDGQFFASRQGVVVVTFNYRLGPLGFFPHPGLAEGGSPLGNQGLLDQQRLLAWVQDNVARFGGDPGNVTIFGESAGAGDVCYHVASPRSRGLFHRAISQSGGCTWNPLPEAADPAGAKAESMRAYAAKVGCEGDDAEVVDCLRATPTEDLMREANQPEPSEGELIGAGPWSFGAVVDGPGGYLPEQPRRRFERGRIARVPYILGSNDDEGRVFVFSLGVDTQAEYEAEVRRRFPDLAAEVLAEYPASDYGGDYTTALSEAVGDSFLICGTTDTARLAARAHRPVYMYNFDIPWAIGPEALQASHAAEMSHVFGNPLRPDEASAAVGEAMNTYWATFAATGNPNHRGASARWPRFRARPGGDRRLQFDADFDVVQDFHADKCAFWAAHRDTLGTSP